MLVAVDLTDEDAEAFVERAVAWAGALEAVADLVFVDEAADANPYILDGPLRATMSSQYEAWHQQMRDRLAAIGQTLPEAVRGEVKVVRGRAAPALMELIDGCDVVVVGNRPASGLSRLAHGVVAERIARQSHKPVIVLPRD